LKAKDRKMTFKKKNYLILLLTPTQQSNFEISQPKLLPRLNLKLICMKVVYM